MTSLYRRQKKAEKLLKKQLGIKDPVYQMGIDWSIGKPTALALEVYRKFRLMEQYNVNYSVQRAKSTQVIK